MLPIYFSGSISGGRGDLALYQKLVTLLGEAGYRVLAGEVTNAAVSDGGEAHDPQFIFERDLAWIEEVARGNGVLVAEVTTPSLGVGYEIAAARYRFGIPVVALFRPEVWRRCSAMISGDPGVTLIEYDEEELEAAVKKVVAAIGAA
ncbi:MAG TPA: nucleoside 2-deoxyribosyltransferase [Thermoanaerobaculia bacterium]|nr:nucleoside 2-deoxyribosyltransferase [Thermoanaerobaculia bacterium]